MRLQTYLHHKHKNRYMRFKQAFNIESDYAAAARLIVMGLEKFEAGAMPNMGTSKRRHQTADEFLNCPECFPKFEAAFLNKGYVKPER